ncbi:winged helix-turn-helix transcriptional regulator [Paenibacillus algorifonticola]|uniref:winged helix-turn-helix transcriptional regulator n=1 Tax=Paenibacillus algorifonticola TaxID=684063 RepID=UPI003D2B39AE
MFTEDPNKIFTAYRIIGTKWTIHILCTLSQGPKKFGEIFESIPWDSRFSKRYHQGGMKMIIEVSDTASDKIVEILLSANIQNAFLRVGVDEGGSSGLSYTLIVAK